MTELTIGASEITQALERHVEEYTPVVGTSRSAASSRSVTASPACPACRARR